MKNPLQYTLKKILKIARALSFLRMVSYLAGGILILLLNVELEEYIYLIVGIDIIIVAIFGLIQEIVDRRYNEEHNHIGSLLFTLTAGILILTIFHSNVYKVSVMWAVATIVSSTMEINEGLHGIKERKSFSIINLVFAVVEIIFSILLLIEPEENAEHFETHIYLLGIGFILESAESLIRVISPFLIKVPGVSYIPGVQKIAEERIDEINEAIVEDNEIKEIEEKSKKEEQS